MLSRLINRLKSLLNRVFFCMCIKFLSLLNPRFVGYLVSRFLPKKIILNDRALNVYTLVINSGALSKDILELQKIKTINWIIYDQYWFSLWLGVYFRNFPNFCNHFYGMQSIVSLDLQNEIDKFSSALTSYIYYLEKKNIVISNFLLPSYDQGGVRVLSEFAITKGIKTIFFYYEHYTMPVTINMAKRCYEHYSFKVPPGIILVWHEDARKMIVSAGLAEKSRIIVTGPPRFNRWREIHCQNIAIKKNFITLLSFPGTEYWAPFTYNDILINFRDLSKKITEYNFVVKCKDGFHQNETLRLLAGDIGKLDITYDADMIDLLSHSKVVVGFNSLSFLEALLSESHLILPYWGDSKHDPYLLQVDPNDPEAKEIIDVATSRKHFTKLLSERIQGKDFDGNMNKRINYLNKYIYFDKNNRSVDIFEKVLLGSDE